MTPTKSSAAEKNIEIVRQFYSGLNRNDIDFVMGLLHASITRNEFEGTPNAGKFSGLDEMRQHIISGRSTWAEGACEPEHFFAAGNKLVVDVHVKVRLKDNSEWIDGRVADGFAIKDGLVAEFHSFVEKEKAFEWAGTEPIQ